MPQRITRALIRRAALADAAAIARVEVESWQAAYLGLVPAAVLNGLSVAGHAVRWRRLLDGATQRSRSRVWVLSVDDAIVGFTSAGAARDADDDPAKVGEIYTIYLVPRAWGRGLGAALLDAAQADLARRGFKSATIWVLKGNTRARRFYELSGFSLDRSPLHRTGADDTAQRLVRVGPASLPEVRYRRPL